MSKFYDRHPFLTSTSVLTAGMLMTVVSQLPLDFGTNLGALLTWVVLLLGGPTLSILGAIMVVGTIIIRTKEDRDRYKAVE